MTRFFSCLVFAAFLVAGCGTAPDLPNGGVACGVGGLCPSGFACASDGFCYNDGTGPQFDAAPDNCGNGKVEVGETCDPIELCPSSCDDGNACTDDIELGAAVTCNLTCIHDLISACQDGDGCCPDSCNSDTDDDCSATCGNGEVDDGETCDPPESCPTECNDGNACTTDELIGSSSNCNVTCTFTAIRECTSGDGCCPAGCNANNDSDCSASCGNGTIEAGETCDPPESCPTECSDGNACTIDNRVGSADNCNVSCTFTTIAQCVSGDGCCPSGCNNNIDSDCSASCGNGSIEAGETCDPPGTCPTSCDDNNECTIDNRTGQASQCNVVCSSTTIVSCADGDGCCPLGCNANNDDDCSVTCGNGTIEAGETCDPPGSCPTAADCFTGDPCRPGFLTGSATQCNAACAVGEIRECKDEDECCPLFCIGRDSDCETSACGDGFCDKDAGENEETCPEDCGFCGDGFCAPDEEFTCEKDCEIIIEPECGNRVCEPGEGPDGPFECPEDCDQAKPECGNEVCEDGEQPGGQFECPKDCAPECGNGRCEPGERPGGPFECRRDCEQVKPECGNRRCEPGEERGGEFECPRDCRPGIPLPVHSDGPICLPVSAPL